MTMSTPSEQSSNVAGPDPVQIAPHTWWVGQHLTNDHFQCHVYLIEHGESSVLIDPGGLLTIDEVGRKVQMIVDLDQIKWIICHHQDPDITASLVRLDTMVTRADAAVVTHWRAAALLKHYGLRLPFWLVDEHDWTLDLGDRVLDFVFTPYLHFPGAFTTFDRTSGILFSSDIFGGFTDDDQLYAKDVSYFEAMRPFHEHYMPSRDILAHGLEDIERLPIRLIAPQHGKLIPGPLVSPIVERLKTLDCGLYLMVHRDTDIRRLSEMNGLLQGAIRRLVLTRDFREVALALLDAARSVFPAQSLEFYTTGADGSAVHFNPKNRYHGSPATLPAEWIELLHAVRDDRGAVPFVASGWPEPAIGMALFSPEMSAASGVAVLRLSKPIRLHEATTAALAQLSVPLEVALEREVLLRSVDLERERFQELAMKDPLTGLYNRRAVKEMLKRLFAMQDRGDIPPITVTAFDIDHFKRVNDTYGHESGDLVLKAVAGVINERAREGDLAARVGGEEFSLFHVSSHSETTDLLAERIRCEVEALSFGPAQDLRVTISAGVATRMPSESLEHLNARADAALYEAKEAGRNRTVRV